LFGFVPLFTQPGWVRFSQWVAGMALCWEEHTLTQTLTALGLESRWRQSQAWVYGRIRRFRNKQLRCRWAMSGPQVPLHVFVIEMAGYQKRWWPVTTALDLSAAQVVAVWAARFRQEDGFCDHRQRLGMEEYGLA
jgi:hypothetical protein